MLADRPLQTKPASITAEVYCNKTHQTKTVNAPVKNASTLSVQRLIRKSLGADYVLMTWNATCD